MNIHMVTMRMMKMMTITIINEEIDNENVENKSQDDMILNLQNYIQPFRGPFSCVQYVYTLVLYTQQIVEWFLLFKV